MKREFKKKELGAIGIGTLIVFIALILVAAIAAAVIIGTAEELEERAEDVSDDTQNMIRSPMMIIYAEGDVNTGVIDTVYLYVELYGSEGLDMRDIVLHVVATPASGSAVSTDLTYDEDDPTSADIDNFGVDIVNDPLSTYRPQDTPPSFIMGKKTTLKLEIDLGAGSLATLGPNSVLEITTIQSQSSNTPYDHFRTPTSYPNSGIVKLEGF